MPRTQTNPKQKKTHFKIILKSANLLKKKTDNNNLIKIILAYSAIKIKVKPPALYSVLKPETSSDSPSEKSYGVRFVSANLDANHKKNNGKKTKQPQDQKEFFNKTSISNELLIHTNLNKTTANLTS